MAEGIQETKEVLDAAGALGALIVGHLKDGFQPGTDIAAIGMEIWSKPDVKAQLARAADNISKVRDELKDVDALEGIELAEIGLSNAKRVIKALKE